MELRYQWQSQTQSHGARDPNYRWDVDGKKFNLFTKEVPNTTIKIVCGIQPESSLYYFSFYTQFSKWTVSVVRPSVRGFSSQRRFFLFSAGSFTHKFVEPPRDERAMHPQCRPTPRHSPKFLARVELDTMLGPSRACMLKITPARYIRLAASILITRREHKKIAFTHVVALPWRKEDIRNPRSADRRHELRHRFIFRRTTLPFIHPPEDIFGSVGCCLCVVTTQLWRRKPESERERERTGKRERERK